MRIDPRMLSAALVAMAFCSQGSASTMDGSSASNAATSGLQITTLNPAASFGFYWIDPDGPGGNDPFETLIDPTTAGGGWTLGISCFGCGSGIPSELSLEANVSSASWESFDLSALVTDREADYRVRTFNPFFSEKFFDNQTFSDPTASIYSAFGEVTLGNADTWEIWVRETVTPDYSAAVVPLPAALPLFLGALGLIGLIERRQRKSA
ncbi:VPLPA-CTERM sorting domain-containing protein [Meridianimarinicoccus roseus]|uniref:VPLPA-CTERM sorting domain-containing protein n=1 Tax=Meridianimarinicoccus roseus TaxID=2072018 RepID=UPI0011B27324|nr:VPLPA-CTERM sorting domain-containing protein [Meridianimarinicoccus roseus]